MDGETTATADQVKDLLKLESWSTNQLSEESSAKVDPRSKKSEMHLEPISRSSRLQLLNQRIGALLYKALLASLFLRSKKFSVLSLMPNREE